MSAYWKAAWVLFGIFAVANLAFLHRMPGLMGDEASEGENVWEKLEALSTGEPRTEHFVLVRGERSYIGPLIDYVRVPFILGFGYTPLALRLVVVLASLAAFWLAACTLREIFGDTAALGGLVLGFFNPIYLTQARLGWAISLFPFFFFLILWLLAGPRIKQFASSPGRPTRALLAGLAAGIGLSNHILFFPTLAALVVVGIVVFLMQRNYSMRKVLSVLLAVVGFVAAFAMQFWVLLNFREDQGDVTAVAQSFWDRAFDLPQLLPLVLSGSSYVARYTRVEFSLAWQWIISVLIVALVFVALFLGKRKKIAWLWFLGLVVQTIVLLYMIDRFALRYFVMPVVGRWMLAGVGLGTLIERLSRPLSASKFFVSLSPPAAAPGAAHAYSKKNLIPAATSIAVALLLTLWSGLVILVPFLRTGGSTADFSLGNRTDSAAALVDTRPLVDCLRGAGPVSSENVHIWNRLQFLSHEYPDLHVVPQDDISHAEWLVHYRDAKQSDAGDLCPELAHFRIIAN